MTITIIARFANSTYNARIKGQKISASCTSGALAAARAVCRKANLDPEGLTIVEQGCAASDFVFEHQSTPAPKLAIQFTGNNIDLLKNIDGVTSVCMPFKTMARIFTNDPHRHIDVNIGDWVAGSANGPVIVYQGAKHA